VRQSGLQISLMNTYALMQIIAVKCLLEVSWSDDFCSDVKYF
jgi:hypothetical protein